MVFHSFSFLLLFLPAVVTLNWILQAHGQVTARKWLLLIASIFFYVTSGFAALPILAGSLLMNWLVSHRIHEAPRHSVARRRWLQLGLSLNVAVLVVIKYSHFIADNVGAPAGWHVELPTYVLPLGLSFFTIQQIMYLVDCYEELVKPVPLLEHSIFMSFFAYIAAGPITRGGLFIPQLDAKDPPSDSRLATGFAIFIVGLFKKVVLADPLGRFADDGFTAIDALGLFEGWFTAAAYTLQLYFDFSGYSAMALGAALMLGITLPENFNSPLKATSVIDFWKRWHITLSSFITTYLYTPMVRRMRPLTFTKAMLATVLVMAIAGLWHGAAWTFLAFGVLHGMGLVTNHVWRKTKIKLPRPLAWALTFIFLLVSFVVFRANDWAQVSFVLHGMLGLNGIAGHGAFTPSCYPIVLACIAIVLAPRNSMSFVQSFRPSWRWSAACVGALALSLLFLNSSAVTRFIYRDF